MRWRAQASGAPVPQDQHVDRDPAQDQQETPVHLGLARAAERQQRVGEARTATVTDRARWRTGHRAPIDQQVFQARRRAEGVGTRVVTVEINNNWA